MRGNGRYSIYASVANLDPAVMYPSARPDLTVSGFYTAILMNCAVGIGSQQKIIFLKKKEIN